MASSQFNILRTINESYLAGAITRHIRGDVVNINISGMFSLPANQPTIIHTFTDYKPSHNVFAVASVGGSSNVYMVISLQTNGNLLVYNYTGSARDYLYGSLTFCI